MKGYALKFTQNPDDALDLMQDTTVLAIKAKDRFKEDTNIKAWLYTIMRNAFINNYRKAKKCEAVIEVKEELTDSDLKGGCAYNSAEGDMCMEGLMKAVNSIEEKFRTPFMMHYEGFKYEEISEHLGIELGTVKNRIHFARKRLQKKLVGER